jgi:hypothetical protein
MGSSIYRILRSLDTRSRRQPDQRRATTDGGELVADLFVPESKMKIKTDVKAGSGLLDIDVDIDLDLNVNLFTTGKKKVSGGRTSKKG